MSPSCFFASPFGLAEADFLSEARLLRDFLGRSEATFSLSSGALVSLALLSDLACDYRLRLPIGVCYSEDLYLL